RASSSMPRPNGKRNSAVAPTIYRLVLVLKDVLLLPVTDCALLTKSESGTPPFTPNVNGWENAEAAPNRKRNRSLVMTMLLMMMVTDRGERRFLLYGIAGANP